MENHEIGQIIEHTLDSGKRRIVALRTDGMLLLWNWEKGEWTAFMSPSAANAKGLEISEALLQAGRNAGKVGPLPADDRSRPRSTGTQCYVCGGEHGGMPCPRSTVMGSAGDDRIPAHHVDRDPSRGRTDWRRP